MSTNHPPRRPPRPSFPSSSIHGAIYTRVLSPANTPPVGNKRKPRWKNLTNPGESLSTDYPLPESIIPKGYFLVLVPSKSPLICPHPLDPLRSLLSVRSPFATDEERKRREESGGEGGISFSPTFGRTLFFSAARGENYGRVGWKKRDTRVLDSPRWARGSFC